MSPVTEQERAELKKKAMEARQKAADAKQLYLTQKVAAENKYKEDSAKHHVAQEKQLQAGRLKAEVRNSNPSVMFLIMS